MENLISHSLEFYVKQGVNRKELWQNEKPWEVHLETKKFELNWMEWEKNINLLVEKQHDF